MTEGVYLTYIKISSIAYYIWLLVQWLAPSDFDITQKRENIRVLTRTIHTKCICWRERFDFFRALPQFG